VEKRLQHHNELYVSLLVDPRHLKVTVMASTGGWHEEVAAKTRKRSSPKRSIRWSA
jgi:succinyl-CoA synthetase beta subunit